jgi:hypothetical protein
MNANENTSAECTFVIHIVVAVDSTDAPFLEIDIIILCPSGRVRERHHYS